ncbi:sulfatase-like hydrolase/transferase [Winogradskyella costae]|uniref:sulfatase-like hydrolase/transferase n=1 Tax=Winogradskyella costae TaxID=2697008 RepID=UPI0015C8EB68|nr:sulfatase-like hydrolase/transferase [Winogradskyella costae]
MMRNTTLLLLFSILFLPQINGQEIIKPNIVFIYADDLGWQDTQLNDVGDVVPWETPNMLALAEDGANFSQAYASAPTCAPSRGGTMSGRMPLKTKMTHVAGGQIPKVKLSNKTIESYYPGRLQLDEVTIAEALNPLGYVSGHVGKWHMAANHNIYPEAVDQGFDYQDTDRGITRSMGDRSVDFATDAEDDPYRLDADGRPYDAVTELALDFMDDNKEEPFFLYMAHWLVHSPIQTRDLALLEYYCDKLGIPVPTTDANITTPGQTNPYYGAMIASLDWSLGRVVDYLKETDDPRNPGMKLFDTTYIIFASDNGGAENHGSEIITDNFPLDLGKTHTKEGGLRTPFVITGPGIVENQVYDNIVSHLDFYPTIMEVTGADAVLDANVLNNLDGVSLFPFLSGTETEIKNSDNTERTDLFWHYPHGQDERASSAIRSGNYKLYKIYDNGDYYKAYQLYNDDGSDSDIEEMVDVIDTMPVSLKNEMILNLETLLAENDTRTPHFNPDYNGDPLVNQDIVPSITSTVYDENTGVATATLTTNPGDAIIETAYLLYRIEEVDTPEEEWFELPATIDGNVITADVPEVATGVVFTLIDENNFVVISDAISIFNPYKIILANAVGEQAFKVVDEYAELIGNTTIGGTAYLQARTEEGGDGAKFYVKAPADVETITCDKITLGIISQSADTVNVDIIIDGETQSFTYTSTNNNTPELFEFDTPVTFTQSSKEIQVITTSLSNSGGLTPRVRFVDLFFNVLGATQPLSEITLNTTEEEQQFEPESTDVYAELIGNTTTGGAFVQMRTEGGGDGFNINVKATESVLCEKIVFRVRSLAGDTANFDVTIGGETQSFEYTSTNSTADLNYEFDTPTTITEAAQTMEFLVTNLSNATIDTTPRFRVYAVTYHLDLSSLGVDEVLDNREALKLFPNPVKGTFSLSKSVASGVLYSVHGAKAYEFNNQYQDIDISELKTGLYFLQVIHEDGSKSTLKLLKE